MKLIGESAVGCERLPHELEACAFAGRAAVVWCDGQDLIGVFAEDGDTPADVLRMAAKVLPAELGS